MSTEEKQARSVFVGNIPHGTTEEQMIEILSSAGPVRSFRIVFDRETGNPKGYGFAEYADADLAQCAIRQLHGFQFCGRALRVDKASSQAEELRFLHQQTVVGGEPIFETIPSDDVNPNQVPEVIARTLLNLPPEHIVDLMKQMQTIIKEYPNEARNTLIQTPQLAYAMLQSLVIMNLMSANDAAEMLHPRQQHISSLNRIINPTPTAPNLVAGLMPNAPFPAAPSLIPPPPPPPFHPQLGGINFALPTAAPTLSRTDQEKAQLLIQVLQLTDVQIAQLPADQRASIILLREQMQRSGLI